MKNADKPIAPLYGANKTLYRNEGIDEDYLRQSDVLLGLTKREYFAGLAMQAKLSSNADISIAEAAAIVGVEMQEYNWYVHYPIYVAKMSLRFADELLKQLGEGEK